MDRRTSCYLNSAYSRNLDDFDDYVDDESHVSFGSRGGRAYDSETETTYAYVDGDADADDLDDSCFSEDDRLAAFDQRHIGNRSYSLQQLQRYHLDACAVAAVASDRLTSTPKKQPQQPLSPHHHHPRWPTPSGRRHPQRRDAIVRRRSLSSLSYRDVCGGGPASPDTSFGQQRAAIRRSKSSLSLRPRAAGPPLDPRAALPARYRQLRGYVAAAAVSAVAAASSGPPSLPVNRYLYDVRPPAAGGGAGSEADDEPLRLPGAAAVSPFRIRQAQSGRRPADLFVARNPFLRRPYDLNSSCSSSRPLVARNTAVISPIYSGGKPACGSATPHPAVTVPFDGVVDASRTLSVSGDRSMCSSTKTSSSSWLHQLRKRPRLPLCTLRTSAVTLLVSGTLTCLLCIHIISQRGKSYELTFSLVCGFVVLCLGFPCLRFQEWRWLPNRNYVSGYIILSLFSVLQSAALWVLDRYPDLRPELVDLTKGALCGISGLSLSLAVLGVCASCCCKYPPPDNRVNHGVQGFTV